jgi:hypothetical protein
LHCGFDWKTADQDNGQSPSASRLKIAGLLWQWPGYNPAKPATEEVLELLQAAFARLLIELKPMSTEQAKLREMWRRTGARESWVSNFQ